MAVLMASGFPTPMAMPIDEVFARRTVPKPFERIPKYQPAKYRTGDSMRVYVDDGHDWLEHPYFNKYISLVWHWWQPSSPAERIRRAWDKAQKQADKLNAKELYVQHEADLVESLDG